MLEKIEHANDIKRIPPDDLPALADEIRDLLIRTVSRTGGHLASNLGTVELTMALHSVCTLPRDRIVWDVGHQTYTHKILTGRKDEMASLRQEGGLSGFPRRQESPCDVYDAGHSSSSIAVGLGYVRARDLQKRRYRVISVIGDGSFTGGMAFEALNNAAELRTNFIIVLNDNHMSISENVGGFSRYLGEIRTSPTYTGLKSSVQKRLESIPGIGGGLVDRIRRTKSSIKQLVIPGMLFEDMGITYLGPVDGHDIRTMIRVLKEAERVRGPVLVHVLTEKGRGYLPAMKEPEQFHGIGAFDVKTGQPLKAGGRTYTDIFAEAVTELAAEEPRLVAITAAMREGTGLKLFAERYPERFFDTGIAEEHAVSFAAGLALGGQIPVLAVYSAFLQRGFDQIMDDICMQGLHVIFAVDRAGFVGADGRTHQGCFDLSYLSMMPGMTVLAPKNGRELRDMLRFALTCEGPVAIRWPRGEVWTEHEEDSAPVEPGKAELLHGGRTIALAAVGSMVRTAEETAELLRGMGYAPSVVNMRFVKPFDTAMIRELARTHTLLVTMEENTAHGGFGESVRRFVEEEALPLRVMTAAVPDAYIGHASVERQRELAGLDAASLAERIAEKYEHL